MIKIVDSVSVLVDEELYRANKKFPMFRSQHEGIAVLEEEIIEAYIEIKSVIIMFCEAKKAVFLDRKVDEMEAIEKRAILLAAEAIQVAAMAKKFRRSKEEMK